MILDALMWAGWLLATSFIVAVVSAVGWPVSNDETELDAVPNLD